MYILEVNFRSVSRVTNMNNELEVIFADPKIRQKIAQQFFDIWITPEVKRRQERGELECPLKLHAAQVIFFPDDRGFKVRINSEVRAFAKPIYKSGIEKNPDELVYEHEIEGFESFSLPDDEFPDCGFVIALKLRDEWVLYFDFRYNKDFVREHLRVADEFLQAANYALTNNLLSVLIDSLFSAVELTAKALLLPTYLQLRKRHSHGGVQTLFDSYAKLGNIDEVYWNTYKRLRDLRVPARYPLPNTKFALSDEEKDELIRRVDEMIKLAYRSIDT